MTELSTSVQEITAHGAAVPPSLNKPFSSPWKWFLGLGMVLLLLGATGISLGVLLDLSSLLVFGPLLLASGIVQGLVAFIAVEGKESFLHLAAGAVEGILGLLLMSKPPQSAGSLLALIALVLIVSGLLRLVRSLATWSRGRGWIVMTGVLALLLGISIWVRGPLAEWGVVGLCLAVDFLCHGVSWTAVALAERKPPPDLTL